MMHVLERAMNESTKKPQFFRRMILQFDAYSRPDWSVFPSNTNIVTMLLHHPGPQLKLPSWRNKSIYAISV